MKKTKIIFIIQRKCADPCFVTAVAGGIRFHRFPLGEDYYYDVLRKGPDQKEGYLKKKSKYVRIAQNEIFFTFFLKVQILEMKGFLLIQKIQAYAKI